MIIKEVSKDIYQKLKVQIKELNPDIEVRLVEEDINLYRLGFSESILCDIEFVAMEEQIEELMNKLIQIEVDAYDTLDGLDPKESDESYIKYKRYIWIYNFLSNKLLISKEN